MVEQTFKEYFKENVGIEPYSKCPICEKELLPRKKHIWIFYRVF